MASRHSGRKSSGGPGISREARHNLAANSMRICKRRTPTPQNRKVGACVRAAHPKGKSQAQVNAIFAKCASKGSGGRKGVYTRIQNW
jgi:hypothetical protein